MSKRTTFHPAANIFPLMRGVAFESFVEDIRLHGQLEPILINEANEILDGRNRYLACLELGIVPRFETEKRVGNPYELVLSLNLHRRHLTQSQKAALGLEIESLIAPLAKGRMRKGGGNRRGDLEGESIRSREIAARACFVNATYIGVAKRVRKQNPKLFELVRDGRLTLSQASRRLRLPGPSHGVRVIVSNLFNHEQRVILLPPGTFEAAVLAATSIKGDASLGSRVTKNIKSVNK